MKLKSCRTCKYIGKFPSICNECNRDTNTPFSYYNYTPITVEVGHTQRLNTNNGLNGTYYEIKINFPTKPDKEAYIAECNDITEALKMTPHEYNIFKSVWRKAAARLGNGKKDSKALYDAEKCLFAAKRMVILEEQRIKDETNS